MPLLKLRQVPHARTHAPHAFNHHGFSYCTTQDIVIKELREQLEDSNKDTAVWKRLQERSDALTATSIKQHDEFEDLYAAQRAELKAPKAALKDAQQTMSVFYPTDRNTIEEQQQVIDKQANTIQYQQQAIKNLARLRQLPPPVARK